MAGNVQGFAKVGQSVFLSPLGRNFYFITAKLLKLNRITIDNGLYSSAQLLQSRMLCGRFFRPWKNTLIRG
jgi:hypothetical protein